MSGFGQPYWWDGQPAPPKLSTLPERAELLIIGAGYTGLSAAIAAASSGADVCVVDAEHPGFGASSRNGGMAGAHPRLSLSVMTERFGASTARQVFNEAGMAFDYFEGLIKSFKIDCDYKQSGRVQLAWTKADFEAQKRMAEEMNRDTDYAVTVLEQEDLPQHLKTDHYFGGLYYPNHGSLHPKKFVDGLLRVALKLGVKVVGNMPITRLQRTTRGFIAEGPHDSLRADKVLVATNGYTFGVGVMNFIKRRVFPLPSYLIATEKLPKALIQELAPGGRMMVETRARHSYWRISPDGNRVIWGGRASIQQIDPARAAKQLQKTMTEIWPQLAGAAITHAWKGNTGYTFSEAPHVGEENGIVFAAGYCGGGVVLAPYLGMKAAYRLLGDARGETAYNHTTLATRPYHLGTRPWFLTPANYWYHWLVDTRQNVRAREDRKR